MSADNGIYIYKTVGGKYSVRYYCASVDYDDPTEMSEVALCDTIEEAIIKGQEQETEYGLSFSL